MLSVIIQLHYLSDICHPNMNRLQPSCLRGLSNNTSKTISALDVGPRKDIIMCQVLHTYISDGAT